jgi:hypothetical protein
MAWLHLNLKGEYFDQIVAGDKPEEYRLCTEYWRKRLEGKTYEGILLKRGYPKRGDNSRIVKRPWQGFIVKTITHPLFGRDPVKVFSIKVNA